MIVNRFNTINPKFNRSMDKELQLYDLAFLEKFTRGDRAKMERYIQTYLRTSGRIFDELEESGRKGMWEDVYIKAHTVKPQVQYMGISSLQDLILEIEMVTKQERGHEILEELVDSAMKIYRRSAAQLQDYLDNQAG